MEFAGFFNGLLKAFNEGLKKVDPEAIMKKYAK